MRFKSSSVEREFVRAHPKVIALALYADHFSLSHFKVDLMLTDVGRTQVEYDEIYASKIREGLYFLGVDDVKHYAGPRPHLEDPLHGIPSHAVDNRVGWPNEITVAQNERLRDHMNAFWPRRDGKPTMLIHDVGRGLHSHLQAEV